MTRADFKWFTRGDAAYLGDSERQFVSRLGERLEAVSPPGVDPGQTAVRGEPWGADVVVPHRRLEGLAIAARVSARQAEIYWVHVGTLKRSDDFDLAAGEGWPEFSFERHGPEWQRLAIEHFVAELGRPFTVRVQRREGVARPARIDVFVDDRAVWTESRFFASRRTNRTATFTAAFTTPPEDLDRLLAQGAAKPQPDDE